MRLVLKLIFLLVLVVPAALVVAVALLVGALLGGSMNLWILNRQRRKIAKLKSTLKKIERQTAPSAAAVKDAG